MRSGTVLNVRTGSSFYRQYGAAVQTAALFFALALPLTAQSSVIPLPAEVVPGSGSFEVDSTTVLHVPAGDRDAGDAARRLVELWNRTNGLTLEVTADGRAGT